MAKKKKSDVEEDGEDAKGGKLKLIIGAVVLVVVGAFLGGKVLGGGGSASAGAAGPTTTTTEPPGMITAMDTITLNLADGRFLKLGVAFEVRDGEDYPANLNPDDATAGFAREIDATIALLSGYTYDQLVAPDGKAAAKVALLERISAISDEAIKDVYFTEFVMQ